MSRTVFLLMSIVFTLGTWGNDNHGVKEVRQLNRQAVEVVYNDGKIMTIDFYGPNIFRLFRDDNGGIVRNPDATPSADILVKDARRNTQVEVVANDSTIMVCTQPQRDICLKCCMVRIDKSTGLLTLWQRGDVVSMTAPVEFKKGGYNLRLSESSPGFYYGGGVQNGRYSHRGERIDIVNTNSWVDGGVCSPTPFFWSTAGYGVLCHTFKPGYYDFTDKKEILVHHDADYLDVFFMLGKTPVDILRSYYQLTGHPVLLPKFAFYEGHLNAYNRDYWKETTEAGRGILFEDGKRYVESQKPIDGGMRETLNGEGAYQFSARAVIDRYAHNDMPLGWILPNDGYGAGYGQTETLDGNIANLKAFGDYARSKGVETGLWTQSNLHPADSIPALLQRDIIKEVRDAGVRVLKTDVAWVGAGYSFGLNGISNVAQIMPYYGQQARPFIITLDGWAGTQRYAGVWTGDQTGGEWEYIRFHIPTYIGAGLSGQPNITSDMDGIFGGKNMEVNIRDFQWKTFTPMQLNMDGWGANEKYPQALGEPATSINRSYLKLKSMLLPYTYTFAHEAVDGLPLIRAMLLYSDDSNMDNRTKYQYLYGSEFLVAPIYEAPSPHARDGEAQRHGIYLPKGKWHDYFTGQPYDGECVMNGFEAPLWKLPLFVREGAIIPMNNPNNNPSQIDPSLRILEIWPSTQHTSIQVYDDDGTTDTYLAQDVSQQDGDNSYNWMTYEVEQQLEKERATITVHPAEKGFKGMTTQKRTRFVLNMTSQPKKVRVRVNGKAVKSDWHYGKEPFMELIGIHRPDQLIVDVPTTSIYNKVELTVEGVVLPVSWEPSNDDIGYELMFDNMLYRNISDTTQALNMLREPLEPETTYHYRLRTIAKGKVGSWKDCVFRTADDPLKLAMNGLTGTCSVAEQPGADISHLFDLDEHGELWHTDWQNNEAVPFTIDIDMHATTELDHITYVPRDNAGNGTILAGTLQLSADGRTWSEPLPFQWARNNKQKTIDLAHMDFLPSETSEGTVRLGIATTRYLRLCVSKAVGNFGSGAEFYAFRKPGAKVLIPGDINQDGSIDENDLTSYLNYTGLRMGDSDFDGYVSVGDVNHNGIIDAQDISYVTTQLEGGITPSDKPLSGRITMKTDRQQYATGDDIVITVTGQDLSDINALSLVLPYNQQQMEFLRMEPIGVGEMFNMTNDRLHSKGDRVLYPTFVNIGQQPTIKGSPVLFRLHFKALTKLSLRQLPFTGMIVNRQLEARDILP
ncbi:MAG: DUF5110 domain-containing protein [Prevotella sp.]|nr:DUF5110 domain-containing protein [Prevotella sp.]